MKPTETAARASKPLAANPTDSPNECPYSDEFLVAQTRILKHIRSILESDIRQETQDLRNLEAPFETDSADGHEVKSEERFWLSPEELGSDLGRLAAQELRFVDAALEQLATGGYGWDASAERWINTRRLAAVPTATHIIEANSSELDEIG